MKLYAQLVNGRIVVIFSDNPDIQTYHVYERNSIGFHDSEWLNTTEIPYSLVVKTGSYLEICV